jgi:hypothetical protein
MSMPPTSNSALPVQAELIIDRSGRVRQAGASTAEGNFVIEFKERCEQSLYCFLSGVLNKYFLHPVFHKNVCEWLTGFPPYRKLLLMPRNHGKTVIVEQGIPLHAMIQPTDGNRYFEGIPGSHLRLLLIGETMDLAVRNVRVIRTALESNMLLRALWPHVAWDNARKQSKKWSDSALIIPRDTEFAEPTVLAIGVGGAVTGLHPNMQIKGDLTTQTAANEPPTMQKAIEYHQDSRALFANPERDIEFITATYWAAYDLPNFIEQNDPTVEVNTEWRQIVSDGNLLWPQGPYDYEGAIAQLQHVHGTKFPLLYMNTVAGSELCDFSLADVRYYDLAGDKLVFNEDDRDEEIIAAREHTEGPKGWVPLQEGLSMQKVAYLRKCRAF